MPLAAPSPKRLRASVACDQCKASKKRCSQGIPCANCTRRRIECTFTSSTADSAVDGQAIPQRKQTLKQVSTSDGRNVSFPADAGTATSYSLDLPQPLQAPLIPLLDWYFDAIAPCWPVVERADLVGRSPFAAPLLTRAVCLLAALTCPDVNAADLLPSIVESVRQCFDTHDLCARPSMSTLQALLLLLCCPELADLQAPIMVTAACTMAISLGLHRPQAPRTVLYWSCIAWARWEAVRTTLSEGREAPPCFDLESALPVTRPDSATCFGAIYGLLEQAEQDMQAHRRPDQERTRRPQIADGVVSESNGKAEHPMTRVLIRLTQLYISTSRVVHTRGDIRAQLEAAYPCHLDDKAIGKILSIYPFSAMLQDK